MRIKTICRKVSLDTSQSQRIVSEIDTDFNLWMEENENKIKILDTIEETSTCKDFVLIMIRIKYDILDEE